LNAAGSGNSHFATFQTGSGANGYRGLGSKVEPPSVVMTPHVHIVQYYEYVDIFFISIYVFIEL
jgi:hypothetical protein